MQVNHVNSVGHRSAGFVPQLPRPNVTSNSTSTAPVQPSGSLPRPFNVNEGSIADRRSNKGVLLENALVTEDDTCRDRYGNFLSPGEIQDMTEHLKKYDYNFTCDKAVKLNDVMNRRYNDRMQFFHYEQIREAFDDMNPEQVYEAKKKLYELGVTNGMNQVLRRPDVYKSKSEVYQKLTELGIINAQGEIQGDTLENSGTLRTFDTFINNCDGAGKVSCALDTIYKKYDTYYLNEFNEYHWVRYLNSFEVPKASDQQLVNQTDTLRSNTGQEIFDRLLASTILVRSNDD